MKLEKFSIGVGDRFGRQAGAQIDAVVRAAAEGSRVTPVWNKSFREHSLIGTRPPDVRRAVEAMVRQRMWNGPFHVDADHIGLKTVDAFLEACDFFTLDVADFIGKPTEPSRVADFVRRHRRWLGELRMPGLAKSFSVTEELLAGIGRTYLAAAAEAGAVYRHIRAAKGGDDFIVEVSMDECERPQTPAELFFILAALAEEGVPAQTIAPKFTGRFNKGVDYVGDPAKFAEEFRADLAVAAFASASFGLPANLKLSVHSGSDKFSLYPAIGAALAETGAGLHVKTAGTTWLEELIGLAEAGGSGLALAKEIYAVAFGRREELARPYATVVDIDPARLPAPAAVAGWSDVDFTAALRHDPACERFNPHVRQLLHVSFKVAAELGPRYLEALDAHAPTIARNVTENLYERHLRPLFLDAAAPRGDGIELMYERCAWCGAWMGVKPGPINGVSHGLCRPCSGRESKSLPR